MTRISLDEVHQSLSGVQESLQGKLEDKRQTLITVAAAGGLVLLILFFLLGRRSGKKKTTFVEIRRV
jgi:VIT1/CCC1 family predicted Fe2+/Mn2+ transporter